MALEILQAFLDLTGDADRALPALLHEGVRTGVKSTIPPSGVFETENRPRKEVEAAFAQFAENWRLAILHRSHVLRDAVAHSG